MKGNNPICPCGSGLKYGACCRPFHRGEEPKSPEALMRSRYSAFALGEVAYLWRTLHPDHPDRAGDEAAYLAELRRSRVGTRFVRLRVLDALTDPEGQRGEVLFHAEIFEHGADRSFLERSTFLRTPEGWRYRDGVLRAVPARSPEMEGMTLANVRFD